MSPSDQPSFDLINEPWLRVRDLLGQPAELGILRAVGLAHELSGLSGDVPTQTFALCRMLLAVLHGALAGPRDDDEWAELWAAEKLPARTTRVKVSIARRRSMRSPMDCFTNGGQSYSHPHGYQRVRCELSCNRLL